jgi:hypothetical protein
MLANTLRWSTSPCHPKDPRYDRSAKALSLRYLYRIAMTAGFVSNPAASVRRDRSERTRATTDSPSPRRMACSNGGTSAPLLPQSLQTKPGSRSETSSGHGSVLIAIEWLQ